MSHPDGQGYYHRRLLQAQASAEQATLPEVRAIHREFAQRYAELIGIVEPDARYEREVAAVRRRA